MEEFNVTSAKIGRPPPLWFARLSLVGLDPEALYTAAEIAVLSERANQTVRLVLHARLGKPEMIVVKDSLHLHAAWRGRDLIAAGKARLEDVDPKNHEDLLPVEVKKRFRKYRASLQSK